jgi:hypothetical protein
VYNLATKQYSIAPAEVVPTEKTVFLKKGDVYLRGKWIRNAIDF